MTLKWSLHERLGTWTRPVLKCPRETGSYFSILVFDAEGLFDFAMAYSSASKDMSLPEYQ
jgi:hypothetical protein